MGFGDLGKKSILKRTKIEYSASEPLARKIASYPITSDLIEDLFDINDKLLLDINFIKKIEKQFPTDNDLLEKIFLNYLNETEGALPKITSDGSFSALCKAYTSFNQSLINDNKSLPLRSKLKNLFVFGQYKNISLENESLESRDIFTDRIKVISQCNRYSSISGMIEKKQKFSAFGNYDNAIRAYNTITNFDGSDRNQICLSYWGLVFIALLNKEVNPLIQDYFSSLPHETHIKTKEILLQYTEATIEIHNT